jgi:hypothetical protein
MRWIELNFHSTIGDYWMPPLSAFADASAE